MEGMSAGVRCRGSLTLTLLVCGLPTISLAADRESARPLGIVVILADDLGWGDLQFQNPDSRIPTPHLDRLAASGLVFSDAHSPSAVCTPTRYGLLTGRYSWRGSLQQGVLGGYSPPLLEAGRETLGSLMQRGGYRTAAVGKWHLGMQLPMLAEQRRDDSLQRWDGDPGVDFAGSITDGPLQHGFDECFGVTASLDMPPYVFVRNAGFALQPTLQQQAVKFPHFVRAGPRSADFVMDQVLDRLVQEANAFLRRSAEQEQSFFLYLPLTAPHKPAQPHPRFRGLTQLGEYGDFVAQVDAAVGSVLTTLQQNGQEQRTLVFFSSDNGSYMYGYTDGRPDHTEDSSVQGYRAENHRANAGFRGTKADIHEAGHHVPLIVRWPERITAGGRCEEPVCLTDVIATCAEVTAQTLPADSAEDSCSLVPTFSGSEFRRSAPVIHHSAAGMFAIRDGRWKLIAGNGSGGRAQPKGTPFEKPFQLYDLQSDPGETRNLIEDQSEVAERLVALLDRLRSADRSVERR